MHGLNDSISLVDFNREDERAFKLSRFSDLLIQPDTKPKHLNKFFQTVKKFLSKPFKTKTGR